MNIEQIWEKLDNEQEQEAEEFYKRIKKKEKIHKKVLQEQGNT